MSTNFTYENIDLIGKYLTKERYQELLGTPGSLTNSVEIQSWGKNNAGQVGDGTTINRSAPVGIPNGGSNWISVSANGNSSMALKQDGTLWTWGLNDLTEVGFDDQGGILGIDVLNGGARSSPNTIVSTVSTWKQITNSGSLMAAVDYEGRVFNWGLNTIAIGGLDYYSGLLGRGLGTSLDSDPSPEQVLPSTFKVNQIKAAGARAAAIRADGRLFTWGGGASGALGQGSIVDRSSPQSVLGSIVWKSVSIGYDHMAAISNTTELLYVFGNNTFGQLGLNHSFNRSSPTVNDVVSGTWKSVSCGGDSTAAIKNDGTLWTWGSNASSQLGNGTGTFNDYRSSPQTTVAGGTDWKQVSIGGNFMAAIKTDGTLWTWGGNNNGQLGNGSVEGRSSPQTTVAGGTGWLNVSASTDFHVLALKLRDFT